MKNYYRVMLGRAHVNAEECHKGNFIGVNLGVRQDLTGKLPDEWREFNKAFIPKWMETHPGQKKVTAGYECGQLWTFSRGIQQGDIVLCPNGGGSYWIGEIVGAYTYQSGHDLPHRRTVRWYPKMIEKSEMSENLRKTVMAGPTVICLKQYAEEIDRLIAGSAPPILVSTDETVENPSEFAMEQHLEDFLVQNWKQTELGRHYDIYEEEAELVGQQYHTDTGPIDILAISKNKKELLVVELKKGRASDTVVGQVQRYMGFVLEELAEDDQKVKGVIIAMEKDTRIRRALAVAPNIDFYHYQISFKLTKE